MNAPIRRLLGGRPRVLPAAAARCPVLLDHCARDAPACRYRDIVGRGPFAHTCPFGGVEPSTLGRLRRLRARRLPLSGRADCGRFGEKWCQRLLELGTTRRRKVNGPAPIADDNRQRFRACLAREVVRDDLLSCHVVHDMYESTPHCHAKSGLYRCRSDIPNDRASIADEMIRPAAGGGDRGQRAIHSSNTAWKCRGLDSW